MNETPIGKESVVLKLLSEGDVMICLDARRQGVRVPPQHANDPALRLILNLNFPYPIEVTAEGISAKLSFGGRRMACYVPMQALWAAFEPTSRQGMMWPDSMPPEILAELAEQQPQATPARSQHPASAQPPAQRPRVAAQEGRHTSGAQDQETNTASQNEETSSERRRGHLRIVK
jgi:stringent starvation protein B